MRFPVNVHSPNATYEMQFGAVERPTHYTTSYDLARYEVPGHRWADLSEHGFGVALLTDSKYGYSTFANEMRISLLRAPKMPDPVADQGSHRFRYAIYPHEGRWQDGGVVAEGFDLNAPFVWSAVAVDTVVAVDTPNLVVDTIKLAEREDAIVLRLYEAHGARGHAHLSLGVDATSVVAANLLEDETGDVAVRRLGDRARLPPVRDHHADPETVGRCSDHADAQRCTTAYARQGDQRLACSSTRAC